MCFLIAVNHPNNPHHADKRPTIAQLQLLQVSGRKIKIIQTLAAEWNFFGYQLNFDSDGSAVDLINRRHPNDPEQCCKKMLQMWLRGNGVKPVTWRKLAELIEDFNYGTLAADIQLCFNI